MNSYVLLLHETALNKNGISPEEIQATIARYKAWGEKLAAAGRLAGGHKLEHGTARVMAGEGPRMRITDGPYAETKDVVAGLFVIRAETYEEAVELAKDCPHLSYGTIELRKIDVV
jgi:hypothetical protein